MSKFKKKILVIGGGGYVGTPLVTKILNKGYEVDVIDLFYYGNFLVPHENLKIYKIDVRNIDDIKKIIKDYDCVIHLACISNDPSFELNPDLSRTINFDCFEPLVQICKDKGVKRFIYASSSSVYGVKKENNVVENMKLEPITDYSKFKAACEDVLHKFTSDSFVTTIVRPATVCGYSPRQRLDVIVNIMSNFAFNKNFIKVFGGSQLRPNIHIDDMINIYLTFIDIDSKKINGKVFNAGKENLTLIDIASKIKKVINPTADIKIEKSDDLRSYHISSRKIEDELKFIFSKNIEHAAIDLKKAFSRKLIKNSFENEEYFNVKMIKKLNIK